MRPQHPYAHSCCAKGQGAVRYVVTGPVLGAAGVQWDLLKAQPYSGYDNYDFRIPTRLPTRPRDRGTHALDIGVLTLVFGFRPLLRAQCCSSADQGCGPDGTPVPQSLSYDRSGKSQAFLPPNQPPQ